MENLSILQKILEYFGEGANSLSCTGKGTICNMGAEVGATTSTFSYDDSMDRYLCATGRSEISKLANSIKSLGKIYDKVSLKVRDQYEKSPYPRWRFTYPNLPTHFLNIFTKQIKPNEIVIDNKGTNYQVGDVLNFDNTDTGGIQAKGFVKIVNGGIITLIACGIIINLNI